MGIKMGSAIDNSGVEWLAKSYEKGKGKEPLRCAFCQVQVTHQSAHARERDDKSYEVSAYFRLFPGGHHAKGCKYAVIDEVKKIANESMDMVSSLGDGKYRLRLVMIQDALTKLGKKPSNENSGLQAGKSKTYERASSPNLIGYINSAKRVLQLRTQCDSDNEIANYLELVFEGSTVVSWSQFYFDTDRHLEAYQNITKNTIQYPIALHGTVTSKSAVPGKSGVTNVINFAKAKYIANAANGEIGVGVEVSVWCKDADWFSGIEKGDEVVVPGMWKGKAGEPLNPSNAVKYRYKLFMTHKLSISPVLKAQIVRVPPL